MNYSIMLSLRFYLSEKMTELNDVQLIYDGNTLSNRVKPFSTVEYLTNNSELLSAGRKSYEDIFRYQVGLYTNDFSERSKLEEILRTQLRNPDGVPIYTESGIATDARFVCDVSAFTAMSSEDGENETNKHRGYFDVAVRVLRNTGESTFTQ